MNVPGRLDPLDVPGKGKHLRHGLGRIIETTDGGTLQAIQADIRNRFPTAARTIDVTRGIPKHPSSIGNLRTWVKDVCRVDVRCEDLVLDILWVDGGLEAWRNRTALRNNRPQIHSAGLPNAIDSADEREESPEEPWVSEVLSAAMSRISPMVPGKRKSTDESSRSPPIAKRSRPNLDERLAQLDEDTRRKVSEEEERMELEVLMIHLQQKIISSLRRSFPTIAFAEIREALRDCDYRVNDAANILSDCLLQEANSMNGTTAPRVGSRKDAQERYS